jgi:hypothetical protein
MFSRSLDRKAMKKNEEHEGLQRQQPLKGYGARIAAPRCQSSAFIRAIRVIRGSCCSSSGIPEFNPDAVPEAAVTIQAVSASAISPGAVLI